VYYSFCLRKSKSFWVFQARGEPAADRVGFNVDGDDRRSGRLLAAITAASPTVISTLAPMSIR